MYIAKESIIKNGVIYDVGAEVDLTDAEAKYLADKVEKKTTRKPAKKDESE